MESTTARASSCAQSTNPFPSHLRLVPSTARIRVEPCAVGNLSDKVKLKTLLTRCGVKLEPVPGDYCSALVPYGKSGKRRLVVRDAKFLGHRPVIDGLAEDENIDDVLDILIDGIPKNLVNACCLPEHQRSWLCSNILEPLMSGGGETYTDQHGKEFDPVQWMRVNHTPEEWQRPNIALLGRGYLGIDDKVARMLLEMNRRYAIVDADDEVCVHDSKTKQEYSKTDFYNHNVGSIDVVEEDARGNKKTKTFKKTKLWFESPARAHYIGRGLYPLGKNRSGKDFRHDPATRSHFNMWKGWAVEPKEGDCHCYKDHLRNIVCRGVEAHYDYAMNWLAHMVQKPWEKPRVAMVTWGIKQIGKSLPADIARDMVGVHSAVVDKQGHVCGRFANLSRYVLVQSEEALYSGNPETVNITKHAITAPMQRVEYKNGAEVDLPSYTRFWFTANSDKAVAATYDDERFFVLNVDPCMKGDKSYFQAIVDEAKHGGLAALLYELQRRNIEKFVPWDLPFTPAFGEMALATLASTDGGKLKAAIITAIREGAISIRRSDGTLDRAIEWHLDRPLHIEAEHLFQAFCKAAAGYGETHGDKVRIGNALQELGIVIHHVKTDNSRNRGAAYVLLSLADARETVAKLFKVTPEHLGGRPLVASEREQLIAQARAALDTLSTTLGIQVNDPIRLAINSRILEEERAR